MTARHFLDTNVLLYSISTEPSEAKKRERARELLDDPNGAMSVQVLQEFYVQSTRATRSDSLNHDFARGLIESWCRFPVQDLTLSILRLALDVKGKHRFTYWDSAIIAAALALGCRTLYSEDMSHGREIEGLTIINPFR